MLKYFYKNIIIESIILLLFPYIFLKGYTVYYNFIKILIIDKKFLSFNYVLGTD